MIYTIFKNMVDPIYPFLALVLFLCCGLFACAKKKWLKILAILTGLTCYGLTLPSTAYLFSYPLEKDYLCSRPPVHADIVVVLGGGLYEIPPAKQAYLSQTSTNRIMRGIEIFKETHAKYLVCMGKGPRGTSEALLMAQTAQAAGIPLEKIRLDECSTNTFEHAAILKKMFENEQPVIALVTSASHMKRSEREFKKYFKDVVPYPSDYLSQIPAQPVYYVLPSSHNLERLATAWHEYIGLIWYEWRDRKNR